MQNFEFECIPIGITTFDVDRLHNYSNRLSKYYQAIQRLHEVEDFSRNQAIIEAQQHYAHLRHTTTYLPRILSYLKKGSDVAAVFDKTTPSAENEMFFLTSNAIITDPKQHLLSSILNGLYPQTLVDSNRHHPLHTIKAALDRKISIYFTMQNTTNGLFSPNIPEAKLKFHIIQGGKNNSQEN